MSSIQEDPRSDDPLQIISEDKIEPNDILNTSLDNTVSKNTQPKYRGNTRTNVARRYVIFEKWNKT
jgi:hypothetical protein